jgi:pentatricopeptide repeat protein
MEAEDLRIGPFIYHAAVCAYVRADDPEGGLSVLRRLHLDGERALVETYDVLIKGFVLQEDLDRAYDVVRVGLPVGAARFAVTVSCL